MSDRHRTPRAHLASTPTELPEEVQFPVTPALVEHLKRQFPVTLSPYNGMGTLDSQLANATDQAEQRGRQQVIEYLGQLSQKE